MSDSNSSHTPPGLNLRRCMLMPIALVSCTIAKDGDEAKASSAGSGKADAPTSYTSTAGEDDGSPDHPAAEGTNTGYADGSSTSGDTETGGSSSTSGAEEEEPADLILHASGLPQYEGWVVSGAPRGEFGVVGEPASAQVVDGSFTLEIPDAIAPWTFGVFITLFFHDDDGSCTAEDAVLRLYVSNLFSEGVQETEVDFQSPGTSTLPAWCEDWEGFEPPASHLDCVGACEVRTGHICYDHELCESFCFERVLTQSEKLQNAFITCMNEDPLCFSTPQYCVQRYLDTHT